MAGVAGAAGVVTGLTAMPSVMTAREVVRTSSPEGEVVVGGGDGDAIAGEEGAAGDADDVFERAALEGSVDVEAWGDERVWFGAWGEFDGDWERAAGAVDFCGGADEGCLD